MTRWSPSTRRPAANCGDSPPTARSALPRPGGRERSTSGLMTETCIASKPRVEKSCGPSAARRRSARSSATAGSFLSGPSAAGPVVADGGVYFAAGVWRSRASSSGLSNARTGQTIWVNDRTGTMYLKHPHDAPAFGGPSPMGYLLVRGDELVVPSGRSFPAFFDRRTGQLTHFEFGHAGHGSCPRRVVRCRRRRRPALRRSADQQRRSRRRPADHRPERHPAPGRPASAEADSHRPAGLLHRSRHRAPHSRGRARVPV